MNIVIIILLFVIATRFFKLVGNKEETNWKNEVEECTIHFTVTLFLFFSILSLIS
jgi:hypothetical protein